MSQSDRISEQIINAIETNPDIRKRVFEGLGIPTYVTDMATRPLRERIDTLEKGVNTRFDGIDTRFDGIDTRLEGIESNLRGLRSAVMGNVSERRAQPSVLANLGEIVDNPVNEEVLLSQVDRTGTSGGFYMDAIKRARANGPIHGLAVNYQRMAGTDLVVRVESDGVPYMVAVEISTTVDNGDVMRAIRSANLITSVFDLKGVAAVAGPAIRIHTLAFAEFIGVKFIQVEPEEEDDAPEG